MTIRKRTLRRLPPLTRDLAKLTNQLDSLHTRLSNFRSKLHDLENSHALLVAEAKSCPGQNYHLPPRYPRPSNKEPRPA